MGLGPVLPRHSEVSFQSFGRHPPPGPSGYRRSQPHQHGLHRTKELGTTSTVNTHTNINYNTAVTKLVEVGYSSRKPTIHTQINTVIVLPHIQNKTINHTKPRNQRKPIYQKIPEFLSYLNKGLGLPIPLTNNPIVMWTSLTLFSDRQD